MEDAPRPLHRLLLGGKIGVYAEKKAWVKYENGTLTFQYGEKESLGIYEYELNVGSVRPAWFSIKKVLKVEFAPSFASARPTSCYEWFRGFQNLKTIQGIEYLNTSNVANMAYMFFNCPALTSLDISNFNTSNVTSMSYMFAGCSGLTSLDVSNFYTSNVTNMGGMFYGCSGLTILDLSNFNTSKVTDMYGMFMGCSKIETIFASDKFDVSNVQNGNLMFTNCNSLEGDIAYDANKADKTYATADGGYFADKTYARPWVKYADGTLTFQYGYKKTLGTDEYLLNEGSNRPDWNSKSVNVTKVVFDKSFAQARPTSCYHWFYDFNFLVTIEGVEYLNTSNVTDMSAMFYDCMRLSSVDLSNFNTSKVTDMSSMFSNCRCFSALDVSNFDTSNVTSMSFMFYWCPLRSLDVSNFNTSKVTTMSSMFGICQSLSTLDLSNFDTSNVTNMSYMFYQCDGLTSLDVSNFNTSKVTDMSSMFQECTKLTSLDLANFDTRYVTDMKKMFFRSKRLTYLNVSSFDTSKVTDMSSMFYYCNGLTSLDLSNFDTSNVTDMSSMFYTSEYLKAIYCGDKFAVNKLSSVKNGDMFYGCPATLYCSPLQYEGFKNNSVIASAGNAVKPYVGINWKSEYGTLCVPVGSSLAEGSFTGFDKLYQVTNADKDKGTITLTESKSIEPGVPYVYHRYLEGVDFESKAEESSSESSSAAKATVMSIITFDVDENASASVTAPKNEGSLLKGTFESMLAKGGSYILQSDGNFHPVATDNTTLKVGAYRAYLDLSSTEIGGGDEGFGDAKAYRMVFEDGETTGIDRIHGEGADGSDKGIYDQADQQPKVYFDLMGRKVNAPLKGEIYIVNGKKIVYNK